KIKFHPKDQAELISGYSDYAIQGKLPELFSEFDVVIGMSTMALLHAFLLGVKTYSYQPHLVQADMCITNKLGLTLLINDISQLSSELDKFELGINHHDSV